MIEINEEQAEALRLLGFWWGCFVAERELNNEPAIPSDCPVLHYCGCGTTAMVEARHLNALREIAP